MPHHRDQNDPAAAPASPSRDPGTLIAGDATLADAVARVRDALRPRLVVVDDEDRPRGVLHEDDLRLGLAGRARLTHPVASLARPAEPDLPVDADGRALPLPHCSPPRVGRALLMAGGQGTRLRPLTDRLPKPLLPVGGRPILHRLVAAVAAAGIPECYVSVHYLPELVRASVGDGSTFGLRAACLEEAAPLGTAGALGLVPPGEGPLLVMNGDILTDVNLASLFAWHERHGNAVTVATHLWEVHVPFGLAHFDGQRLERLEEKPTLRLPVNAGIYVFSAEVLAEVRRGEPLDMVTWLNALAQRGIVGQFPIVERWHDLGTREEYERLSGEA